MAPASSDGGGTPDDLLESYFVLQRADLQSDDWPDEFTHYDLFICSMSLTATDVAEVRLQVPDAILLVYMNAQSIPIYLHSDPIYELLADAFDSTLCLMDLVAQEMITLTAYEIPEFIFMQESADVLVAFHRDVTMAAGWDGIYIDQCNEVWPVHKRRRLRDLDTSFDCNADGIADDVGDLLRQYELWRPYFVAELRAALGPDAVLLGNTGGRLIDANLNGITIENVGTRFKYEDAKIWMLNQRAVSMPPVLGGCWATKRQSLLPCRQFARELEVYFGDNTPEDDEVPFPW